MRHAKRYQHMLTSDHDQSETPVDVHAAGRAKVLLSVTWGCQHVEDQCIGGKILAKRVETNHYTVHIQLSTLSETRSAPRTNCPKW